MMKHSELSAADRRARVHHYKRFRAERPDVSAVAHWQSALAHVHFMRTLAADIKETARRSVAAKRGWAKRRELVQ